jgi:O-antigen/teichoic acid export membrane protein
MRIGALVRGGAFGFLALAVEKGAAMGLVIALARTLAAADYGRYSFIVSYLTFFQVLADFGVEPIALRRFCQEPERRAFLMANVLGLRVALALVAGVGAVLIAPSFSLTDPSLVGLVALGALGLLFPAQTGYRSLFRSELRLGEVMKVTIVSSIVMLGLASAVLVLGLGIGWVFVACAAANLLGFASAAALARPLFRFRIAADLGVWREILAEAWPIGANLFLVTITLRLGPLLLMYFRGPAEVGYFAGASKLVEGVNLLADATMLTLFPVLAACAVSRPNELRAIASLAARYLSAIVCVAVLVVSELAPAILGLVFKPEFVAAAPSLVVLTWWSLFATLGVLYTNVLVAVGKQRTLLWLNCGSSLLHILLELALVGRFGMTGVAVAIVLANAASHLTLYFLPATAPWLRSSMRDGARPVAVTIALVLIARWLPLAPLSRTVVLLGAFATALAASRIVAARDLAQLRGLMRDPALHAPGGHAAGAASLGVLPVE